MPAIIRLTIAHKHDLRSKDPRKQVYFLEAYKRDRLTTDALCHLIEKMTSLSTGDVLNVLATFTQLIGSALADGQIVELDDFGTFKTNFKSRGKDAPEMLSTADIRAEGVSFLPKPKLKRYLKQLSFRIDRK